MIKVGDRVICVDASAHAMGTPPPLIKGRHYLVYGANKWPCGCVAIDVGLTGNEYGTYCSEHGSSHVPGIIHWCSSKRFRKVQEKVKYVKLEIEKGEPQLN